MKYINQFLIILLISFLGEILKCLLPLPIPASIYGMIILFLGLMTKVIKLESVKETGKFLIEIMPIMFIPAGVGLMTTWGGFTANLITCQHHYCSDDYYSYGCHGMGVSNHYQKVRKKER